MKVSHLMAVVFVFAMASSCSSEEKSKMSPNSAKSAVQQLLTFEKTISKTLKCRYLLYLPKDYSGKQQRWPLILFLHGAGERGDNLDLVKKHGPPKLIEQGKQFPFIVLSPQCPADQWWSSEVLINLLDEMVGAYKVDTERIYLTGLSMGGFGTWDLASLYPERFAAIAPICGGGRRYVADRLKDVPVWAFHGGKDPVVPLKESEEMVKAVKAAGGDAKLTVYPDAYHDSWTAAYDNPELYDWFLSHHKSTKPK